MRDIIWTVIVIWIVWKIYDTFKTVSKPKSNHTHQREGEVRIDKDVNLKSHFNPNDGEYVDYEEIK